MHITSKRADVNGNRDSILPHNNSKKCMLDFIQRHTCLTQGITVINPQTQMSQGVEPTYTRYTPDGPSQLAITHCRSKIKPTKHTYSQKISRSVFILHRQVRQAENGSRRHIPLLRGQCCLGQQRFLPVQNTNRWQMSTSRKHVPEVTQ